MTSLTHRSVRALLGVALLTLAACDSVTDPPPPVAGAFTVDASADWAYVSLADSAVVSPATPRESSDWDIAFFATNVMLNGGAAGPGGVTGACLCQNAGATSAQILAMTPDSELGDFEAVVSVPASAAFSADALTPAVSGWYTGAGASAAAVTDRIFLVKLSDGASYAKVHVTGIAGASAESAGEVTLEYAVQETSTAAFGATKTIVLESGATAAADLNADAHTTAASDWDLKLEGWNVLVNGGVSGPGSAAVADGEGDFASITTAVTAPQAYRQDKFAGVFAETPWYRYNLAGDNRISPTFDVFLVKRGSAVYKVQVINYYNATGAARHISFRYEQIAS